MADDVWQLRGTELWLNLLLFSKFRWT